MNALLDALGWVGESLDKPGAAVRGLLAGRPDQLANLIPFSDMLGITDPSQRVSGRGLLEQYGALAPKEEGEGFGLGDVAGIGAEMALDPTNLLGAGALKRLIGVRRAAQAANANREMLLAKGAMPEGVARRTKAVDEFGNPVATYHGTPHAFDKYDMSKMDPEALLGPGIYQTENPDIASAYPQKGADKMLRPIDFTNPYEVAEAARGAIREQASMYGQELEELRHMYGMPIREIDELSELGNIQRSRRMAQAEINRLRGIVSGDADIASMPLAQKDLSQRYESFGSRSAASPNVRKQFLDTRNPFDIDKTFSNQQAESILRSALGDPLRQAVWEPVPASHLKPNQTPSGQELYDLLAEDRSKAAANESLKSLGYDAITHMGGGRAGGGDVMHRVYIAFDPRQIYQPLVVGGQRAIPSASPILAALAGQNALARSY